MAFEYSQDEHYRRAAPYLSGGLEQPHVTAQAGMAGTQHYKNLSRQQPAPAANANKDPLSNVDTGGSDWLSPVYSVTTPVSDSLEKPTVSAERGRTGGVGAEPYEPAAGINTVKATTASPGKSTKRLNVMNASGDKMTNLQSELAIRLATNLPANLTADELNNMARHIMEWEGLADSDPHFRSSPGGGKPNRKQEDDIAANPVKTQNTAGSVGDQNNNGTHSQYGKPSYRRGHGATFAQAMPWTTPSPPT